MDLLFARRGYGRVESDGRGRLLGASDFVAGGGDDAAGCVGMGRIG